MLFLEIHPDSPSLKISHFLKISINAIGKLFQGQIEIFDENEQLICCFSPESCKGSFDECVEYFCQYLESSKIKKDLRLYLPKYRIRRVMKSIRYAFVWTVHFGQDHVKVFANRHSAEVFAQAAIRHVHDSVKGVMVQKK